MTPETLMRLWRTFRRHQSPSDARVDPVSVTRPCVPQHCHFLVSTCRSLAVCQCHGLVHYCTEETCHWWVTSGDARVCLATATCYPLHPEDAADWRDVLTHEHATCFAADNPFAREYQDPTERSGLGAERAGTYGALGTTTTSKKRKDTNEVRPGRVARIGKVPALKAIRRRSTFTQILDRYAVDPLEWTEDRMQRLIQEAFSIVFTLLGSPERARLDAELRDSSTKHLKYRFQTYIEKRRKALKPVFFMVLLGYVWEDQAELAEQRALSQVPAEQIRTLCSLYAKRSVEYFVRVSGRTTMPKYQFRYHVLACCYTWSVGIKDQADWLLEPDEALRRMLPKDKYVQKLGYISRTFTRHWKELRQALVKLSIEPHLLPSYTQAPLPRSRSAQY